MIYGMIRCEQRFDGCAFGPEDLAIKYRALTSIRLTFENPRYISRIVGNQVCYTASMIFMPMGQRMYDKFKGWT
jgi:hypothetical protein